MFHFVFALDSRSKKKLSIPYDRRKWLERHFYSCIIVDTKNTFALPQIHGEKVQVSLVLVETNWKRCNYLIVDILPVKMLHGKIWTKAAVKKAVAFWSLQGCFDQIRCFRFKWNNKTQCCNFDDAQIVSIYGAVSILDSD